MRNLVEHRKFRDGDPADVGVSLQQEKQANPKSIPYAIVKSVEKPGDFELLCVRNESVGHEIIQAKPRGFKYNNVLYNHIDALLNAFKLKQQELARPPPVESKKVCRYGKVEECVLKHACVWSGTRATSSITVECCRTFV